MVSYLRKKTNDPFIWDKVTARSWNVPFIFHFAFICIEKGDGGFMWKTCIMKWLQVYRKTGKPNKIRWSSLHLKESIPERQLHTPIISTPQEMQDGSIVVRKSGIGDIEQLVVLKNGRENKIFTQGIINDAGMQSAANGRIVGMNIVLIHVGKFGRILLLLDWLGKRKATYRFS